MDGEQEARSVEEIGLVSLLHLQLRLAGLHHGHVGGGVVACSKLEDLDLGSIFLNFDGGIWVNFDSFNLVSELSLGVVGALVLLLEHEFFLPLGLLFVPCVEFNSHLHKDDEM